MADQGYRYFFSYVEYTKGEPFYFGNFCIDLPERIEGYEQISRVQGLLEKKQKDETGKEKQIVILNYQLVL